MDNDKKKVPVQEGERPEKIILKFGNRNVEAAVDNEGHLVMPEEVNNLMELGFAALQKTQKHTVVASDTDMSDKLGANDGDEVVNKFKGLPMRELIGAPLFAAAEAQEKLASIALDFYKRIAYEDDGETTRLLKFTLSRPVVEDGVVKDTPIKQTVEAPFIGLVPIPSLLVNRVDIDFQMEVTDTNSSVDKVDTDVSTNVSSKWFGVNVGISGKAATSRENTRSTNQTAKYQIHVTAGQQPQTEGLSKLMDIMASCIEPIPTTSTSGS